MAFKLETSVQHFRYYYAVYTTQSITNEIPQLFVIFKQIDATTKVLFSCCLDGVNKKFIKWKIFPRIRSNHTQKKVKRLSTYRTTTSTNKTQKQGTKNQQHFSCLPSLFSCTLNGSLIHIPCLNMSTFIYSNYLNIPLKSFKFF